MKTNWVKSRAASRRSWIKRSVEQGSTKNGRAMQHRWKLVFCLMLASGVVPIAHSATVEYIHTDALGSPVAVTNSAGVVIERREYEPYGKQTQPVALSNGPGYTGHVSDAATGLDYMQQRYYDPGIGRFLSVDPVTADGNTSDNFNRYWYANNNPYKFTDPDGRRSRQDRIGPDRSSITAKSPSAAAQMVTSARSTSSGGKINAASALDHFKGGSGAPLRMNFGDIDTSSVRSRDFGKIRELIDSESSGKFNVDARTRFITPGSQYLMLGDITLRAQGTLVLRDTAWAFNGTMKAFDDPYNMNPSTHRAPWAEALTRMGGQIGGQNFLIEIRGSKPLIEQGER